MSGQEAGILAKRRRGGGEVRLADLYRAIVADYEVGSKCVRRVHASFKPILRFFGLEELAVDISYDRLMEYTAHRLKKCKPGTVRVELRHLGRAFRLLHRSGRIDRVPPFPTLNVDNVRQGFFEDHELAAVISHLPWDLRNFVLFLNYTGWRRGEVQKLRWVDVDFPGGVVRLPTGSTKNKRGRVFPFSALPELQRVLEGQRKATTELENELGVVIPVVFWRDGRTFSKPGWRPVRFFCHSWKTACKRAGYPGRTPHDFRRTAVRRLERAGVPRGIAMALTGHRTESVYRRYDIVNEADLASGVKRLATHLTKPKAQGNLDT